jgi:SET domain
MVVVSNLAPQLALLLFLGASHALMRHNSSDTFNETKSIRNLEWHDSKCGNSRCDTFSLTVGSYVGLSSLPLLVSENVGPSILPSSNKSTSPITLYYPAAPQQCGIWFAKSTVPGGGLGMFAGRDFEKGQDLMASGDIVTPIVDFEIHNFDTQDPPFLWNDYTWSGFAAQEATNTVHVASPGFGSAANSILDLVNVEQVEPHHDEGGLTRRDPGAGAFSSYHNRRATAVRHVQAGQELFENYGDFWFTYRTSILGHLPIKGDHAKAQLLLDHFETLLDEHSDNRILMRDLWETFVLDSSFKGRSRALAALPTTWQATEEVLVQGLLHYKRAQHSISLEWLQDHGTCADHLVVRPSTVTQAGRGAFAHSALKRGSTIAPLPLIHIPERRRLNMYKVENNEVIDRETVVGQQLLLNYCMGHRQSTLLLCPYGALTSLINHNQTRANAKLQWASPERSNQQPSWLEFTVEQLALKSSAGLSMEIVATRDIEEGEEILLDYGNEWEMAWQHHVTNFDSVADPNYISAAQINADQGTPFKTEFDILRDGLPYPSNIEIKCSSAFLLPANVWMPQWRAGNILKFIEEEGEFFWPCEIVNRTAHGPFNTWHYTVVVYTDNESNVRKFINVPREAIRFFDRPCTSSMHWSATFRHDIRVPDEIFPAGWKNSI